MTELYLYPDKKSLQAKLVTGIDSSSILYLQMFADRSHTAYHTQQNAK